MNFFFYKYHGTGNDFVMIDNRTKSFPKEKIAKIAFLCNRHFGIGADGLILLEDDHIYDFRMIYFNADGSEGTMCGNGGRCIVAFAKKLGIIECKTIFIATDGLHNATIKDTIVSLQMINVDTIKVNENFIFVDTGSPHHIQIVKNIDHFNVLGKGRKIRNDIYGTKGSNVNFVEQINQHTFKVRTYERGVEDETLACGTGVTAVALAMYKIKKTKVKLMTKGGVLEVSFTKKENTFLNIFLTGAVSFVFKGTITI